MDKRWNIVIRILLLIAITVWLAVLLSPDENLHIIACDVGQGDAFLAIQGKNQILVDGGPDSSVLDCLSSNIPFWDREIEVVVLTHPQTDHFAGLIDVFRRHKVNTFLVGSLNSSTSEYRVLKSAVGGSGAKVVEATSGMNIRLGLMHLDIAWPTEEFVRLNSNDLASDTGLDVLGATTSNRNINDFSVVFVLSVGEFDALFTGDIGPEVMDEILGAGKIRDIEYLKVPHHGSKNGLTKELLDLSNPEIAVISVGENNPHGHPYGEVIKLLGEDSVAIFRTDEKGDIEIVSDGRKYWIE